MIVVLKGLHLAQENCIAKQVKRRFLGKFIVLAQVGLSKTGVATIAGILTTHALGQEQIFPVDLAMLQTHVEQIDTQLL